MEYMVIIMRIMTPLMIGTVQLASAVGVTMETVACVGKAVG